MSAKRIIIITSVLALLTWAAYSRLHEDAPRQPPLTANQLFYKILADQGLGSDVRAERARVIFERSLENRDKWSELTVDQMREAAVAQAEGRKLQPMLEALISRLDPSVQHRFPDIFVGELQDAHINATSRIAPSGGLLIIVRTGLSAALYHWSKAIVGVVGYQISETRLQPDVGVESLKTSFRRSLDQYVRTGAVPERGDFQSTELGFQLAGLLGVSATEFVLAHEFAHALLGHVEASESVALRSDETSAREFEADDIALKLILEGRPKQDVEGALMGMTVALALLQIIETGENYQRQLKSIDLQMATRMTIALRRVGEAMNTDNMKLLSAVARALNVLQGAAIAEPNTVLSVDDQRKATFREHCANRQLDAMLDMVKRDPAWFGQWASKLIELALLDAKLSVDTGESWAKDDPPIPAEKFALAWCAEQSCRKANVRCNTPDLQLSARELARLLLADAEQYREVDELRYKQLRSQVHSIESLAADSAHR